MVAAAAAGARAARRPGCRARGGRAHRPRRLPPRGNDSPLRVVVGPAFVLSVPGDAFVAALFPEAGEPPTDPSPPAAGGGGEPTAGPGAEPVSAADRGVDGVEGSQRLVALAARGPRRRTPYSWESPSQGTPDVTRPSPGVSAGWSSPLVPLRVGPAWRRWTGVEGETERAGVVPTRTRRRSGLDGGAGSTFRTASGTTEGGERSATAFPRPPSLGLEPEPAPGRRVGVEPAVRRPLLLVRLLVLPFARAPVLVPVFGRHPFACVLGLYPLECNSTQRMSRANG